MADKPAPDAVADTTGVANPAPATEVAASGAFIEPAIVAAVDVAHPAVDNNPRAGVPAYANAIVFNDPTPSGADIVERQLKRARTV